MTTPSVSHVEYLLSKAFGRTTLVNDLEPLPPWNVTRAAITADQRSKFIVKWRREASHGPRAASTLIRTEAAPLQFLAEINFSRAPKLIAADDEILIIEDLAPRRPLSELLIEQGYEAYRPHLIDYVTTLGDLGACTAGLRASLERIRTAYVLDAQQAPGSGATLELSRLSAAEAVADLAQNKTEKEELAAIAAELSSPGAFSPSPMATCN